MIICALTRKRRIHKWLGKNYTVSKTAIAMAELYVCNMSIVMLLMFSIWYRRSRRRSYRLEKAITARALGLIQEEVTKHVN